MFRPDRALLRVTDGKRLVFNNLGGSPLAWAMTSSKPAMISLNTLFIAFSPVAVWCYANILQPREVGYGSMKQTIEINCPPDYQTEYEIQRQALQALRTSLGVVGLIRFMQQYDKGFGNYTLDRQAWQKTYSVDSLFAAIKA